MFLIMAVQGPFTFECAFQFCLLVNCICPFFQFSFHSEVYNVIYKCFNVFSKAVAYCMW